MRDFFSRSVKKDESPDGDAGLHEDGVLDMSLDEVLRSCLDAESLGQTVPLQHTLILQSYLHDAERIRALQTVLMELHEPSPHNRLFSYLKVLCWSLLGEHDSAKKFVADQIFATLTEHGPHSHEFSYFCNLSRVAEYLIDRSAERQPCSGLVSSLVEKSGTGRSATRLPNFGPLNTQMILFGLQAGSDAASEDKFLVGVEEAFAASDSLQEKTQVASTLLMEFRRSLANYSARLSLAREYYVEIRAGWVELIQQVYSDWRAPQMDARATIDLIYENIKLADQLEEHDDVFLLQRVLLQIANSGWGNGSSARVAEILFELDPIEFKEIAFELARRIDPETSTEQDLESFFAWALQSDSLSKAETVFVALSSRDRRNSGCLPFVRLQARHQKFERADYAVRQIQAQFLSDPENLDPVLGLDIFLASMEVARDLQLSRQMESVLAPARPKGIVLLMQRTSADADKIPVTALLEFKRRGWAVVPLYADVLPYQSSGNSLVDEWARVLTTGGLRFADFRCEEAEDDFVEDDFEDDYRTNQSSPDSIGDSPETACGHKPITVWDQATLEARVLGETRAVRRRWHVDPECPYFGATLRSAIPMLERLESVLSEFNDLALQNGIKVACLVTGSQSLIDRFCQDFCSRDSDPRSLSCWVSDSTLASQLPELEIAGPRSGLDMGQSSDEAFPWRPPQFDLGAEISEETSEEAKRFRDQLRSTLIEKYPATPETELNPDARLALKMIDSWRAKGGRVACVFGESLLTASANDSRSPDYEDIKHWLNDVIRIANDSSTMLIIRPSVAEKRPPVSQVLNETFGDLIDERLMGNIVLIQPEWLRIWELAQRIDLALTYSTDAAIESAVLEIPTLSVVGSTGNCPDMGLPVIQNSSALENALRFKQPVALDGDAITRVSAWLNRVMAIGPSNMPEVHSRPIHSIARKEENVIAYFAGRDTGVGDLVDEMLTED